MQLPWEQEQLIRDWILDGRSDEEIAHALTLSVKQIRPIRAALEAEVRPR